MKVSVVTTVLNEAGRIGRLLDSLVGQEGPFEVVVVDAGSRDTTVPITRLYADRLDLKVVEKPGCTRGEGLALGVEAATGEAVAFIGGDDWAAPGWIAALRHGLSRGGIVVGHNEIEGDRRFDLPRVGLLVEGQDVTHPGSNTAYLKADLARLGGFDLRFVTAEDVDLNVRAVRSGLRLTHVPNAVVHRTLRHTGRSFLRQAFWNGYGRKQLTLKHQDLWSGYSFRRMVRDHGDSAWGWLRMGGGAAGYLWAALREAKDFSRTETGDTVAPLQRACVVGLGIVGIPVAAKLAEAGLKVTGLDVNTERVAAVAAGRYPFTSNEPGLADLLKLGHDTGRLTATTDPAQALKDADVVLVAVQTPVEADGKPRYDALRAALATVGAHLRPGALVIIESTLSPGSMRSLVLPTLEKATGRKAGQGFLLGHCPERVRPGRLLRNLVHYTRVVGGYDAASTQRMLDLYRLYVKGHLEPTDMTTAEVVKTTENAYRDVQIAFANEVGLICQDLGVDAWRVRDLVNRVEETHMRVPGAGVGGHCIPKDGLLLASAARSFKPAILPAARAINEHMPKATVQLVADTMAAAGRPLKGSTVVVLGAAYLPGSDDLRHTPTEPIVDGLKALGATVRICDPYVHEKLAGLPVTQDLLAALQGADAVVLSTAHEAYVAPDWVAWGAAMRTRVAVDGRGVWDAGSVRAAGFSLRCLAKAP